MRFSAKRLFPFLAAAAVVFSVVWFFNFSDSSRAFAVRQHIDKIAPQWERFKADHPEYAQVNLYENTKEPGLLGVGGYVQKSEQLADLRKFIESTNPPRPVEMMVQVEPGILVKPKAGAE